jgi:hypothetical protein
MQSVGAILDWSSAVSARRGHRPVAVVAGQGLLDSLKHHPGVREALPHFGVSRRRVRPEELKPLLGTVQFFAPIFAGADVAMSYDTLRRAANEHQMPELAPEIRGEEWRRNFPMCQGTDDLVALLVEAEFVLQFSADGMFAVAICSGYWPSFFGTAND